MLKHTIIQTERLILRPWCHHDLKPLAKLYADPRVMKFWKVKTFEESAQEYNHFVTCMKENGWGFWAVELKESNQFMS